MKREILVEYKDVTESKITIAESEIRVKISTKKSKELQEFALKTLLEYAHYFLKKEYKGTVRFSLCKSGDLRLRDATRETAGMITNYLKFEEIQEVV